MKTFLSALLMLSFQMALADTTPLHGAGEIIARMGVMYLPDAVVKKLLPEGLTLAAEEFAPEGHHPLIIGFGLQNGVHPILNGVDLPRVTNKVYLENALLIPFVKYKGSYAAGDYRNGPFVHMPIMYLDDMKAVIAGKAYAFPKKHVAMMMTEYGYHIASFDRREIADVGFLPTGSAPVNQEVFKSNLEKVGVLLNQPLIGKTGNTFICSFYDWKIQKARMAPAPMHMKLQETYLQGLAPLEHHFDRLDQSFWGSFDIKTSWTLTSPKLCSR